MVVIDFDYENVSNVPELLILNLKCFFPFTGATYILTGLHHNTPYVIRVMSRNAAGLSVPSPPLRCQTHRLQPYDVSSSASLQSPPNLTAAILSAAVILAAAIFHKTQIPAETERRDFIFNFNRPEAPLAFSTIDKSESLNRC